MWRGHNAEGISSLYRVPRGPSVRPARTACLERIADLGLTEPDLDRESGIALRNPYANPRAFGQDDIRRLLQDAYDGRRPSD